MSPIVPQTAAPVVVWFRRDLRLADNPALAAAARDGRPIIPLFIHDPAGPPRPIGAASAWWLDKSLKALMADLAALGSPLILRRGNAGAKLRELITETGASAVFWNRLYDSASMTRDAAVSRDLSAVGIDCQSFNGTLLNEPLAVKTGAGGPYRVFSPYWRAVRMSAGDTPPSPAPARLARPPVQIHCDRLADWNLHPSKPDWSGGFADWAPGEAGARARLDTFLDVAANHYIDARNEPGVDGTSRLSAHLHFGEISPRQVWAAADYAALHRDASLRQIEVFQKELGWREFNHHLLFHFPHMTHANFNPKFDDFAWRRDGFGLDAWRAGRTGYPIVDAGMRQLWATGWMHNRVRMIVASFLIKDLMIDWREGETWFWDTLVDADLANNVANWQWTAGSGADAAPYFRVFNPTLQGEKFDPAGEYVRRWVPEIAHLPATDIHQPWRCVSSSAYLAPIVDHAAARDRALAAYESIK